MTESEKYIHALKTGDEKVTLEIYERYHKKIRHYILKNGGNTSEVDDVFHDALLYLIVLFKNKPVRIVSFEGYFFTVCKNIWKKSKKTSKKEVINELPDTLVHTQEALNNALLEHQRKELYIKAFQQLSDNCRNLLGCYFSGSSYEQLLVEFNYSTVNTVRQRIFKCKTKLMEILKKNRH